ncbi:Type IV / VI secretion system, DotU domain protein [Candidatus Magnetomorum sp. HK-1]|nr:Type IV / VI secretion system, DotU domain protein [Candidatus Magnetomorum sp. HK-1]
MSIIVQKAQPVIIELIAFKRKVDLNQINELIKKDVYNILIEKLKTFKSELDKLPESEFELDGLTKNDITKNLQQVLAMLCDEIIVNTKFFKEWNKNYIEKHDEFFFLNPGFRSVEFYNIYNRIGKKNKSIEDFFYICMAMGFEGDKNKSDLQNFKEDLISIRKGTIDKQYKLTPSAGDIRKKKSFYLSWNVSFAKIICIGLIIAALSTCWWYRHEITYPIEEMVKVIHNQELKSTYNYAQ